MMITEQDIFNFIFYRHLLTEEKIKFIRDAGIFKDEINFYLSLKDSLIPKSVYILKPRPLPAAGKKSKLPRLAAASADLICKTEFSTFSDNDLSYLGRLLKTDTKMLLYIISADENIEKKIQVKLFPSEEIFILNNLGHPLEIPAGTKIDQISIKELD